MFSSWINFNIYPIESNKIGGIIVNGNEGEYLSFPSLNEKTGDFEYSDENFNTYLSNDYGLNFNSVIFYYF